MNKIKKYRDWKVGDDIYIKGKVIRITNDVFYPIKVSLSPEDSGITLTKDGKYIKEDTKPCASFLPTEQSLPFDEIEVKIDTPVWVRDNESEPWEFRFFSHFEEDIIRTFVNQLTSKDASCTTPWGYYSFDNPFNANLKNK